MSAIISTGDIRKNIHPQSLTDRADTPKKSPANDTIKICPRRITKAMSIKPALKVFLLFCHLL